MNIKVDSNLLPIASSNNLGIVQIGTGLNIENGTISINPKFLCANLLSSTNIPVKKGYIFKLPEYGYIKAKLIGQNSDTGYIVLNACQENGTTITELIHFNRGNIEKKSRFIKFEGWTPLLEKDSYVIVADTMSPEEVTLEFYPINGI